MSVEELPDEPDYDVETPRTDVADDMQKAMEEALFNAVEGRVRDAENERVRIKWLRAFIAASTEYRQLISDIEAREQEERIERLEQLVDELA